MISKLPRWVGLGGWTLAFIAGMVNIVGLLGFEHQAVTHVTGTTSLLAAAATSGDLHAAAHLLAVIGAFVAGAALGAAIVQDSTLRIGRHYGVALLVESAMLFAVPALLNNDYVLGVYLASAACGLQNAMVSTYSGAVVRTTHLSGMFTDLGILLGHAARNIPVDRRRVRLFALIISGFFAGGVAGALAFARFHYDTIYFPAAVTGLAATFYIAYSARTGLASHRTVAPPGVSAADPSAR